jgi:ATP-binding cassette subfamily F protein 3
VIEADPLLGHGVTIYEAASKNQLREALAEQAKLKGHETDLEERWMAALETLEALQAELEAAS